MKKILLLVLLCMSFTPIYASEDLQLAQYGKSAILIDADSGIIMYAKNEYEQLHPASMTKMMGMLLIYEQIQKEQLQWSDTITVSAYAASMGGSQIYLEENEQMTLEELFTAICVSSANDAMVAVAEHIGGTEAHFVQMMNDKVSELQLENTHFSNTTGLDITNHYSCAYDMAMIAKEVLNVSNGTVTQFTSLYETYLRQDTSPFWLVNTNKLIRTYEGMDGLKTGFTQAAGYCLTATAVRNEMRLIAVVMKEETKEQRNTDIKAMLDYGFSHYEKTLVYEKGTVIDSIYISNGKPQTTDLVTMEDIYYTHEKGQDAITNITPTIVLQMLQAPIYVQNQVAQIRISFPNGNDYSGYLTVSEDILALDYLDIVLRYLKQFLL